MKHLLAKAANWKFIVPAIIAFVGCIFVFQSNQTEMGTIMGEETTMIDLRSNYDLAEINDFFTKLKPEGRQIHQFATAVTDSIFPFAYGTLYILLTAFFIKGITRPDSNWMYISLFPILLMIVDFKENFNTLDMLEKFPNLTVEMVSSASKITGVKAMIGNMCLILILFSALIWVVKWILNRRKTSQ